MTSLSLHMYSHTMHEWVMKIHYRTWMAQGRFTDIILTPSKQWGVCDNGGNRLIFNSTRLYYSWKQEKHNKIMCIFYGIYCIYYLCGINIIWKLDWNNLAFMAKVSNYIPQNNMGCNYVSKTQIYASGMKVLLWSLSYVWDWYLPLNQCYLHW